MNYDIDKVIVLNDESGNEMEIEYIDSAEYDGKRYALFMPLENDDDEVIVMQYDNVSSDYDSFIPVEDMKVCEKVYDILRKRYKPQLDILDKTAGE